jgi:hypothetical protein
VNVFGQISLLDTLEAMAEEFDLPEPKPDLIECSINGSREIRPVWRVEINNGYYLYLDLGDGDELTARIDINQHGDGSNTLAEVSALYMSGLAIFYIERIAKLLELSDARQLPESCHVPVRIANVFEDKQSFKYVMQFDPTTPVGQKPYTIVKEA